MRNRDLVEAIRFPAEDTSAGAMVDVREVRQYMREVLGDVPVNRDDVDSVTAEIVNNAVKHTNSGEVGGSVRVAVFCDAERARVEFTDDGGTDTVPMVPDCMAESGRGLVIVEALTDKWGFWKEDRTGAVTVWFEVLFGEDGQERACTA